MSKLYICNNSFGSRINVGDTVELFMGVEMSTPWTSKVYWNMLNGAFVDAHPGHVKMKLAFHRRLGEFINQDDIETYNENDEPVILKTYCKKVKSKKIRV